jgi:hypothetical protein
VICDFLNLAQFHMEGGGNALLRHTDNCLWLLTMS